MNIYEIFFDNIEIPKQKILSTSMFLQEPLFLFVTLCRDLVVLNMTSNPTYLSIFFLLINVFTIFEINLNMIQILYLRLRRSKK